MWLREGENYRRQQRGRETKAERETGGRILFVGHKRRERECVASLKIAVSAVAANQHTEIYTHSHIHIRIYTHTCTHILEESIQNAARLQAARVGSATRPRGGPRLITEFQEDTGTREYPAEAATPR